MIKFCFSVHSFRHRATKFGAIIQLGRGGLHGVDSPNVAGSSGISTVGIA